MNSDKKTDIRVAPDAQQSAVECAHYILGDLEAAIDRAGHATFAISGGHSPKPMFEELAKSKIDWSKIHVFWVDERCVPPDSEQSNFKLANEGLLKPARIPEQNVHRILGELDPDEAAARYVADIKNSFGLKGGSLPGFDVLHRGIGPDVHTASLFPGEPLINDRIGIAAHVWVEKLKMDRVTLLPGVLLAARRTVMQAAGADKAEPIYDVLYGPEDPLRYPCQIATRNSETAVWFLDRAAAGKLSDRHHTGVSA